MKTKKFTLLALSLVLLLTIAACAPTDTDDAGFNNRLGTQTRIGQNNWRDNNISGTNDGMLDNGMGMNNDFNDGRLNNRIDNMGNNANELARRIGALPEVERAAVAISGNRAVVGLSLNNGNNGINGLNNDVNNGLNNGQISSALRQRIETMVKEANRNITEVSITADEDLFDRIQNMSNGNGFFNTLENDFEDLFRTITPGNNINNRINR